MNLAHLDAQPRCSGNCQQGRAECDCYTGPTRAAEAATEIGCEDQSNSADAEILLLLIRWLCWGLLGLFAVWLIAGVA